MKRAPKKLSALITLALGDLEKVERSKKYVVDMVEWHSRAEDSDNGKKCSVCFAGAVMAKTCGLSSRKTYKPSGFGKSWEKAFFALNQVRMGQIWTAMEYLGFSATSRVPKAVSVPQYEDDPANFKIAMKSIAADLKAKGL